MFSLGFFGTHAAMYMDIATLFFALLPFGLAFAIFLAIKKYYEAHYKVNLLLYVATLLVVILFEVGVRVDGGFLAFMEQSRANYAFLVTFLSIHILIALIGVVLWSILIYSAVKEFRLKSAPIVKSHKRLGKIVFTLMSIACFMGVGIYYMLFLF